MSGCESDPLNPNCVCTPIVGNSSNYKILNTKTSEYFCCNVLVYNGDYQTGRCSDWETFNLPTYYYSQDNSGPTTEFLSIKKKQKQLSNKYPLAEVKNGIYTCKGNLKPKYMEYDDPNNKFNAAKSVVCVSNYNNNDEESLAFYGINGCEDQLNICTPTYVLGDKKNIGSVEYKTNSYRPNLRPNTENVNSVTEQLGMPLVPFIIIIVMAVVIVVILILFGVYLYKYLMLKQICPIPDASLNMTSEAGMVPELNLSPELNM